MATSKKISQRIHAKRRASERYGLTVNRAILRDWVTQIVDGTATVLSHTSNRTAVCLIQHEGNGVKVVYDRHRKTIVTCLPPDLSGNH